MFSFRKKNKVHDNKNQNILGDGKAVLSVIDDGVISIDQNGNINLINPSAEQITGWNNGDANGLVFSSVLKITNNEGRELEDVYNPVLHALKNSEPVSTRDFFIKTQSGKVIPVFLNITIANQDKIGVVVVFRSIAKELAESREQAEFISTASHEMRTPVASIEGYLGLALNPATATIDARAHEYLLKAHMNTQHLGQLFQDLLDVTKADDGRLKNEPVLMNAVDFTREIWEGLKPKADEKSLNYIFDNGISSGGERIISPVFYVYCDRDHLHEILGNLIENAIKYTLAGEVRVNVSGDANNVYISVSDSGIGIPAEDIPHLFQKFYRVDNTETREIGGTGLGLYLCRRLAEAMGGTLSVTSEYKKGSTFTLRLPRPNNEKVESLKTDLKKTEIKKPVAKPPQPLFTQMSSENNEASHQNNPYTESQKGAQSPQYSSSIENEPPSRRVQTIEEIEQNRDEYLKHILEAYQQNRK